MKKARQTAAGGVASAIAILLAWAMSMAGVEVPAEVVAAVSVIVMHAGNLVGEWME